MCIADHIKRMEESKSIGDMFEWKSFLSDLKKVQSRNRALEIKLRKLSAINSKLRSNSKRDTKDMMNLRRLISKIVDE